MKKILDKIKKWRLIGYITIGGALYQRGFEVEVLIVEMFLLILLTELSVRSGKGTNPTQFKNKIGINDSASNKKKA